MIQKQFRIISNKQIAQDIYSMMIDCSEAAAVANPGQFVNVLCRGKVLRRPISICQIDKDAGNLTIVYQIKGEGTAWMATLESGQLVDILAPLGNGFTLPDCVKRIALLGGGIGVPPLLAAAEEFTKQGVKCDAFLGFRNKSAVILENEFNAVCENVVVTTDDGSYGLGGSIVNPLKLALSKLSTVNCQLSTDLIMACGPHPMLKAVWNAADKAGIPAQISLEERMACGMGACVVCVCKIKDKNAEEFRRVCKDGPVFDGRKVVW